MTNTMTLSNTTLPSGVTISTPSVDLTKKAIALQLSFGVFGNTKKVSMSQIDVKDASGEVDKKIDKNRIRASKRLLESKELEAIKTFDRQVRKYVNGLSLPYGIGEVMVPFVAVEDLDKQLAAFASKREGLIAEFVSVYPNLCKTASVELGSTYRPQDYAPVQEVSKEFLFYWKWVSSFNVPEVLAEISPTLWNEARAKATQEMDEATAEMKDVMRESMLQLVDHMAERLKHDPETGKPLIFKDTLVSNLTEFLGTFNFRNITDDTELAGIVEQARGLLKNVDPQRLRNKHSLRKQVQKGMEEISVKLDAMLTTGGRKFRLNEE
jgi:hypothetical protein